MAFGITGVNASIVDQERKGSERTLFVVAKGVSRRAAKRAAQLESRSIIPVRDQDVDFIGKERSLGRFTSRYQFRITHNEDY